MEAHIYSPLVLWLAFCVMVTILCYLTTRLVTSVTFYQQQRILKQGKAVISEYVAPKDLTAAELGYMFDRQFGLPELSATVTELIQQGFLLGNYSNNQVSLRASGKKSKKLDWLALEVLGYMSTKQGAITWQTLVHELGLYGDFQKGLEKQVKRQLVDKGYLLDSNTDYEDRLRKWLRNILGLLLSVIFVFVPLNQALQSSTFGITNGFNGVDQGITIFLSSILAVVLWPLWNSYIDLLVRTYFYGSGLPIDATGKLRKQWRDINGYRIFLKVVESARQKSTPSITSASVAWCMAINLGPSLEEVVIASSLD